jgi:flagellar assembly protein FliH
MALDPSGSRDTEQGASEDSETVRLRMEEAFKQGLEQGRAEITAAQQEQIDQAANALQTMMAEVDKAQLRDRERMETETVHLALAIAKKILGHESRYGQVAARVVKSAMQKVADPRQLVVKLNPLDLDAIIARRQEIKLSDDPDAVMAFEGDEAVGRGGCVIETRLGDIDARIDRQIKIIEDLLLEQLPKPAGQG